MPTFRRPSLVWPLLLIGLGALLLLQLFGYLPAGLGAALAQLWPVALILAGLHWLVGRRSRAGRVVVIGAGAVLVAGSLTWAALTAAQMPAGGTQYLAQPPDSSKRLTATVTLQAGALRLAALGPSDHLMEATVQNGPGETARQDYTVAGGEGRLALAQSANPVLEPFLIRRGDPALWDVRLTPGVPLALNVSLGDAAATLDLSGMQLTTLDLSTGLGQAAVTLPAVTPVQANVNTGLGPVTLNLPAETPVRLTIHSGRAQVSLPARLTPAGGAYISLGFDAAQPFLDITLSAGMGGVTVK